MHELDEFITAEKQFTDPDAMKEWRKTPILQMRTIVDEMTIEEIKSSKTTEWSNSLHPVEVSVNISKFDRSDNQNLKALVFDPRSVLNIGHELLPVMVYCHGGGGIFCTAELYTSHAARCAIENHIIVVSLNYRLAPENKAPSALCDAAGMVEYLSEHHKIGDIFIDPLRIMLAGDSGGGYVAVGAAMELVRRGKESCCKLCLSLCGQLADTLVRLEGERAELGADSKNEWTWTLNQLGYS